MKFSSIHRKSEEAMTG